MYICINIYMHHIYICMCSHGEAVPPGIDMYIYCIYIYAYTYITYIICACMYECT